MGGESVAEAGKSGETQGAELYHPRMSSHEWARILESMRQAVVDQTYVLTPHALLEMQADGLDVVDLEAAILTGSIRAQFTDDPRGVRYVVVGTACDLSTSVAVVSRFVGRWLIITVYELKT